MGSKLHSPPPIINLQQGSGSSGGSSSGGSFSPRQSLHSCTTAHNIRTQNESTRGPPVQTTTYSVTSIYAGNPYAVREVFLHSKGCLHPNTYSENDFMVSAAVKGRRAFVGNAPFFAVCFRYAGSCKMSLTRDRMNIKHLLSCPPVSHHDSDVLSCLHSCAINRFLSQTTQLKYKSEKNLNGGFDNLRINAWYSSVLDRGLKQSENSSSQKNPAAHSWSYFGTKHHDTFINIIHILTNHNNTQHTMFYMDMVWKWNVEW